MTLGEKIRVLRKGKYTQEELAYRIGVHVNTLIRWEHDDRTPTTDKLKMLADALGTTPSDLLSADDLQLIRETAPKDDMADLGVEVVPYTQAQTVNRGMLIYDLGNGKKMELPPTEASYNFLRDIALRTASVAVV